MKRIFVPKFLNDRRITFEEAHTRIAKAIRESTPYAMGKIGGTETRSLYHADRILQLEWPYSMSWLKYARQLHMLSGVFPVTKETFYEFCDFYRSQVLPNVDYLTLWQYKTKEAALAKRHARGARFSQDGIFPDFIRGSWLESLGGKRVLVISPFAETIQSQYANRVEIWKAIPGLLPEFDLITLKCPIYSHMVPPEHPSWMAALRQLCAECDALEYDVLIAGAGAWGLPLATHAKSRGKVGIHMGGITQMVFGIKGGRWDQWGEQMHFYNEHWTYPSEEETPQGVEQIEGACYWKPASGSN